MTDPVATLALCKFLRDKIREWETEAKAELSMTAGERKAAAINGSHLGFVTLAKGKRSTHVDEDAFTAWIEERYPMEITKAVRPSFRKKMLDYALKHGALIDGAGEVCEAVTVTPGEPYPVCQLSPDASIAISALMAKGLLGIHGLKEIEGAQ